MRHALAVLTALAATGCLPQGGGDGGGGGIPIDQWLDARAPGKARVDAGAGPGADDGGPPAADAGPRPSLDAGAPRPDAGPAPGDASTRPDAAGQHLDAAGQHLDAAGQHLDAAGQHRDAAPPPRRDAAAPPRDAAPPPGPVPPDPALYEATNARCSNGVDDDGDGLVDCDDRHCTYSPVVNVCPLEEADDVACANGLDDDGDGFTDCADFSCGRNPWVGVCGETAPNQCTDGVDNDGNGFIDCADFGCSREALIPVCGVVSEAGWCLDGVDNDGDGQVDCADADCAAVPCGAGRVGVATWNVKRLFDVVCDTGQCGLGGFEEQPSPFEFAQRLQAITDGIRATGADVVVLQEIENENVLRALADSLGPAYGVRVLGETFAPASMDVALLARGELQVVRRHRDMPLPLPGGGETRFTRELLEVHLQVQGAPLIVFAAHFRSKVDDDPARRLAEAIAAQQIVTDVAEANPGALVLLAGDLNDEPGSPPLVALEVRGELERVTADLPIGDAWSFRYRGQGILIDHIFRARAAAGRYVEGSARALNDDLGYPGSDHAAVTARFDLPR